MKIEYKVVPMTWGQSVYEIVIRKHSYPLRDNGTDTDFSVMLRKDKEWIKPNQEDPSQLIFTLLRYIWNTSQPTQAMWEEKLDEEEVTDE